MELRRRLICMALGVARLLQTLDQVTGAELFVMLLVVPGLQVTAILTLANGRGCLAPDTYMFNPKVLVLELLQAAHGLFKYPLVLQVPPW
jgi:hypothetical protein